MAEPGRRMRARHLLTTMLILIVVGLTFVLVGLRKGWLRRGRGASASQPAVRPSQPNPPGPVDPRDAKRALKERLRALTREAEAAAQENDVATAYEKWREAHELAPEDRDIAADFEKARDQRDFSILFEQAQAAALSLDFEQALTYFLKAAEIRPKDQTVQDGIRFCRYSAAMKAAKAAADQKDWKAAARFYQDALSYNPDGDEAKKGLAAALKESGSLPPQPPQPPTPDAQTRIAELQKKINDLEKENLIESYQEVLRLCDELARLLAKSPEAAEKVAEHRKLVEDKLAGYEKLYAEPMKLAEEALKAEEPGQAMKLLESIRGRYRRDTREVDALIERCRQASVVQDVVLIPANTYFVGSDDPQDHNPKRTVIVNAFFLDRRGVTNQQYKAYVDATGARCPQYWTDGKIPPGQEHHPVMGISYEEAVACATWAGRRLPTEEEFEVAASGGQPRRYPWGDEFLPDRANTLEKGTMGPMVVGSMPGGKSPFGALDMVGNLAEWTSSTAPSPDDPKHLQHIAKGGNFMMPAARCTIASRQLTEGNVFLFGYGFRAVSDATPAAIEAWKKAHPPQPSDPSHQ